MSKCIYGNTVGAGGLPKSYVLETEDGAQLTGILVDEVTVFDATPNDVREGKTYAGEDGVKIGEKFIPSYVVGEGYTVIPKGSVFAIKTLKIQDRYDFTKMQAIFCLFNNSIAQSVATEKVAINENVYVVESTESVATITKDAENKHINFNITNDSDNIYILRYFTYKEIY